MRKFLIPTLSQFTAHFHRDKGMRHVIELLHINSSVESDSNHCPGACAHH